MCAKWLLIWHPNIYTAYCANFCFHFSLLFLFLLSRYLLRFTNIVEYGRMVWIVFAATLSLSSVATKAGKQRILGKAWEYLPHEVGVEGEEGNYKYRSDATANFFFTACVAVAIIQGWLLFEGSVYFFGKPTGISIKIHASKCCTTKIFILDAFQQDC